jgi:hypothetical protein
VTVVNTGNEAHLLVITGSALSVGVAVAESVVLPPARLGSASNASSQEFSVKATYGCANGFSAFIATTMIARPKQKATSKAVIIKMKPNHLPKAADTDGACARIAAIPFNFVRTVFIAESLHVLGISH